MKFSGSVDTPFGLIVQKHSELVELKTGAVLFEEGELQRGLYLISSGLLGAMARTAEGKRRFLYPAFHGTCFSPFPTGRNRAFVSVMALSTSYVYFMRHETFTQLATSDPRFFDMVGDVVNRTFGLLQARIVAGSVEPASERIRAFIQLQDAFQPFLGPDSELLIEDRVSQGLLAEMAGVSRPYFNQQLKAIRAAQKKR